MNSAALSLIVAFITGVLLGAIYFGGLWVTLNQLQRSGKPVLLLLTSAATRMVLLVAGIWFVSGARAERIALCMFGVLISRMLMVRHLQPTQMRPGRRREKVDRQVPCHASINGSRLDARQETS